uniref:heavy metal-associated isoprenylated plant protein 3-like n=1 Tax=Erigeron canadensis TaxID=72917 RepID=UPI001CB9CB34|nr:heavy metal-associated isoprenylated plant protein 3-like [Erigeron canadensis]
MAKKKNRQQNNNQNDVVVSGGNNDNDDAKKQLKVVLKMDLHCEGCAGRVVKAVRNLEGVESVRIGDSCELNKLTVIGNLDPVKLRQKVEEKTKKKVELISPPPSKKQNDGDENTKKKQQPPPTEKTKTAVKKDDDKTKPKELPVTTAVFKVALHCQGCVRRIHKLVTKTKGCVDISFDKSKDLVTVKGAIDMKLLGEALNNKLKRQVEIVPTKKDGGDGEKKGKGGDGEKGKGGNDGEGKGGGEKKGKVRGAEDGEGNGVGNAGMHKIESYGPMVYPYPQYVYGPGHVDVLAPSLFSDENPNACVVM